VMPVAQPSQWQQEFKQFTAVQESLLKGGAHTEPAVTK
jgi:hypothetical protein